MTTVPLTSQSFSPLPISGHTVYFKPQGNVLKNCRILMGFMNWNWGVNISGMFCGHRR